MNIDDKIKYWMDYDKQTFNFIISLQPLNIEGRYPTYKESLLKYLTDEKCKNLIEQSKEFFEWIKLKL